MASPARPHSARSLLVVCVLLGLCARCLAARTEESPKVKPVIPIKAQPFSLSQVRLLDGPFKHAQDLDRKYLLSLDPDRLLHNFRVTAGLPSSAQPYGGWEAPDCEVRGHFAGHYLSACALMYANTGDEKLKQNAEYMVAELAKCQRAMKSGYLSAYPESFIDRVIALKPVWAPWYTLHKILAGLLDVYVYCGDRQSLQVARKFADWVKARMDPLTDEQMQAMLRNEHGGMNEGLANLYGLTGEQKYLALSERFNHHAVMDPLSKHQDTLTGLHANTQIPKFIGAAREYELTGEPWLHEAASFFWEVVTKERSYVIGGHSDGEAFTPKEKLSEALGPNTTETCNTYNVLKLTRHLFEWDPQAQYADYYERALYNHILASQNPETGMMCYYVPLRSGSRKNYNTPTDAFWCCTGTGVENHTKYADSIYFHDGRSSLWVNLFIASELDWARKGVTIRQETRFPDEGRTKLTFTCKRPVQLTLRVRHPFWTANGFQLIVNGYAKPAGGTPGSYSVVTRKWQTGDTLEVVLPMTVRTEGFRDNPRRLAYLYGPIVLCAASDGRGRYPAIVSQDDSFVYSLKPAPGKPLTFTAPEGMFRTAGEQAAPPVTFTPFFRMHPGPYVVYWDVFTPEQWKAKEDAYRAEEERRREEEARSVDVVRPGEEQNERDHKMAGERTGAGPYGDRHWRHATDGGWFQYEVKVLPDVPQDLVCTYWGSDVGPRTFDILVDGQKVATQTLNRNRPDAFFEEVYPLPPDLLKGKEHVTVRFQGHPNNFAGGLFGLRVMRRK